MSHIGNFSFSGTQLHDVYGSSNIGETTSTSSRMPTIKLKLSERDFHYIKYDFSILVQNNIDKQYFFKHQLKGNRNTPRFHETRRITIEKRDDIYMLVLSDERNRKRRKTFLILGDNCYIIKIIEKIPGSELDIVFVSENDNSILLFPDTQFFSNVSRDFQNLVNNMMKLKILETKRLERNKRKSSKRKRKGQKEEEENDSPQQNIDMYNQGYNEFVQYDTFLGRLLYISYFMIFNKLYMKKNNDNTDFFMI